ncbi:hypothetical protein [Desulfopila sp. IMCC35008]|uniref:hypothetical protein n=1 Tax=Desulfopila sp. IMCC35008 TaxID=2653858 RepID=UPI0013D5F605|nr:hypothetical protein [Desulfopila sp. IMCC35008]
MIKIAEHKILVTGISFESCCNQVRKFFDLTSLVLYDCIEVLDKQCCSGQDDEFFTALADAEQRNRKSVNSLVKELQQTGAATILDLENLEHGYPSKVLHLLSHFLDGFIGIDSSFYNLIDDSHWLPEHTAADIRTNRARYWLIHIDCYSATPEEASLLRM